jgi:hypothetical protein
MREIMTRLCIKATQSGQLRGGGWVMDAQQLAVHCKNLALSGE